MSVPTLEEIQADDLAWKVARALKVANGIATSRGRNLDTSLITISEESPPPDRLWRVHYGPRDFISSRGGDLIVVIDENSGVVWKTIRGQ